VLGLGIDLTESPTPNWPLPKRHDPPGLWTVPLAAAERTTSAGEKASTRSCRSGPIIFVNHAPSKAATSPPYLSAFAGHITNAVEEAPPLPDSQGSILLGEVAAHIAVLEIACNRDRKGRVSVDRLMRSMAR
jgi:hypothetical protein